MVQTYVEMRNPDDGEDNQTRKSAIPLTVRQLEAMIRISESLAKMELKPFVEDKHVEEAKRLFLVSTLSAAKSGDLAGAEGFTTEAEHDQLVSIERQIKRRFTVGSTYHEKAIVEDLSKQGFPEGPVRKVLQCMILRGDIQPRPQSKLLHRIK